jgi:hypothetical protein
VHHVQEAVVQNNWFFGLDYGVVDLVEQGTRLIRLVTRWLASILFLLGRTLPDGHFGPPEKFGSIELKHQRNIGVLLLKMGLELHIGLHFHEGNVHIDRLGRRNNPLLHHRQAHLQKCPDLRRLQLFHSL